MKHTNFGAHTRHTRKPCATRAGTHTMATPVPASAMLSTLELRRLVAAMVD